MYNLALVFMIIIEQFFIFAVLELRPSSITSSFVTGIFFFYTFFQELYLYTFAQLLKWHPLNVN